MGISTHINGFVSRENETYKKHLKVLMACIEAECSELPKETADFFGSKEPQKYLIESILERDIPIREWSGESSDGYEVRISEIPNDVDVIRFYRSW